MATLLPVLAWKSETILSIVSLMGFGDSRVISLWARAPSEMPSTTAMSATDERMDFMVRPPFGFNEPGQPSLWIAPSASDWSGFVGGSRKALVMLAYYG